jgi:hypothetical protein
MKLDIFNLPRCTSAELFFSCFGSIAALALANCNEHGTEASINAPDHTKSALHGAQSLRGKSGKITLFPRSRYTRACHRHFLFPVPNYPTQAVSLRGIKHMQAGQ